MKIGIDFDNTIVNHDQVFFKYALIEKLITPDVFPTKHHVGAYIQKLPDGNDKWTELQGKVYGIHMKESVPMPGVKTFFKKCREWSVPIVIVSHRTKYPVIGPKADLREASLRWLAANKFFSGSGLTRDKVYFADTLDQKIARIGELGVTHFIDDLSLVLMHKSFPRHTQKMYFNTHKPLPDRDILHFRSWDEIRTFMENQL